MESTDGNSCLIGDPAGAAHAADLMKALAHPLRLQLIALLSATPLHVTALAQRLGVQQAIVSQQLRILRSLGLVDAVRAGGHATYVIAHAQLRELVRCVEGCLVADRHRHGPRRVPSLEVPA